MIGRKIQRLDVDLIDEEKLNADYQSSLEDIIYTYKALVKNNQEINSKVATYYNYSMYASIVAFICILLYEIIN